MLDPTDSEEEGYTCPRATYDLKHNLQNRNIAFAQYGYGPPNPHEPNEVFWIKKAMMYKVTATEAMTMRCGNCSAFIKTTQMIDCIKAGLERKPIDEAGYDEVVIASADLGYCELLDFKCAAGRTCDAWLVGGPIDDDREDFVELILKVEMETDDGEAS